MKSLLVVLTSCILSAGQLVFAAAIECQPLPSDQGMQGDVLVELGSQVGDSELLQINFKEATYCIVERGASELDSQAGTALHINEGLDEVAIQARLDGVEAWLRLDYAFPQAMVLDRATSEGLGLTDAEFLGDNSLLEASDFFVEFVYSLEVGALEIEDVEANIPRLDVPYDQYAGRAAKPGMSEPDAEFLTVGSIGEELLEELQIIFDFANERIYAAEAR